MTTQAAANTEIDDSTVNGVRVNQVMKVIDSIGKNPENAKFQFRLQNHWEQGGVNSSQVNGFYANGGEQTRAATLNIDADQPVLTAGHDTAPTPVEYVLHALASCLTTTMVYHASVQGIEINSVESSLEGDMDVHGFFGLSDDVAKGYKKVRVKMQVSSNASADVLKKLAMYSPVYEMVSNAVPVEFDLIKV
jgi:uncharacterized OsmC-like protein